MKGRIWAWTAVLVVSSVSLALVGCEGKSSTPTPTATLAKVSPTETTTLSGAGGSTTSAASTPVAVPTATPLSAATPTPVATPVPTVAPTPASSAAMAFPDIPLYAGATATQQGSSSSVPFNQADYQKVEWRWYTIAEKPDKVGEFYRSEMVKGANGWKETTWFTVSRPSAGAYGLYTKDNDDKLAYIFAADDGKGNTQLVVGRAEGKKK